MRSRLRHERRELRREFAAKAAGGIEKDQEQEVAPKLRERLALTDQVRQLKFGRDRIDGQAG